MSEPTGPAKPRSTKGSAKTNQDPSATEPPAASTSAVSTPAASASTPAASTPAGPPPGVDPEQGFGAAGAPTSGIPAATQPLPAAAGAVPAYSEAAPAGPPPVGPPSGPPPAGPPGGPFGPATGGPGGPPPKRPGLWRQATSTTGGLVAVIVAGVLAALLVLGVVATVGLVAVRAAAHHGNDRMEQVREDGRQGLPPGQQRKLDRLPKGPDAPGRQGDGLGNNGMGDGNGMGGLMRGAMGLGAVQHGEFTVQQNGTAVVMTLQRGTVTKASATSVTVKSDDNFTATYVIGTDTRGRAKALAVGDSVLVVADKTGAKAVVITGTRAG